MKKLSFRICRYLLIPIVMVVTMLFMIGEVNAALSLPSQGVIDGSKSAFTGAAGEFSDWTKSKSFRVNDSDAAYGFKFNEVTGAEALEHGLTGATAMWKIDGTTVSNKLIDEYARNDKQKDVYNFYSVRGSTNTAGNMSFAIGPYSIYNTQTHKYDYVDIKITVTSFDKNTSTDHETYPWIMVQKNSSEPNVYLIGVSETVIKREFFVNKPGSGRLSTAYNLKTNITTPDIDGNQYMGYQVSKTKGLYVSSKSELKYGQDSGYHIFRCMTGEETDAGLPQFAAGAKLSGTSMSMVYGRPNMHLTGSYFFGGAAYQMDSVISIPTPYKNVSAQSGKGDPAKKIELANADEKYEYQVTQMLPSGIVAGHNAVPCLEFSDKVEECQIVDTSSVRVEDINGTNRSSWFDTGFDEKTGVVTAKAKSGSLKSQAFYDSGGFVLKFLCEIDKSVSNETLESHGHYNDDKTKISFDNIGTVKVTEEPPSETDTVTVTSSVPDLFIAKTTERYEHQVSDKIKYSIKVKHTDRSEGDAVNVVVSDTDIPVGITMDPHTLTVAGISSKNVELSPVAGGFQLKTDILKKDEIATITFECSIDKSHNGTIVDNKASVSAFNMEDKEDDTAVYINSPKMNVVKTASKSEYEVGEKISYQVCVTNLNKGTFMRDVMVLDHITTAGVKVDAGSIQVRNSNNKLITSACDIVVSGNSISVKGKAAYNIGYSDSVVPPKEMGIEPYDDLEVETSLTVNYTVEILDEKLSGLTVDNKVTVPARENTNNDLIVDDLDIPSGGDEDKLTIPIAGVEDGSELPVSTPEVLGETKEPDKIGKSGKTGDHMNGTVMVLILLAIISILICLGMTLRKRKQ